MQNYEFVLMLRINLPEKKALESLARAEGIPKSLILRQTLHQAFRKANLEGILPDHLLKPFDPEQGNMTGN